MPGRPHRQASGATMAPRVDGRSWRGLPEGVDHEFRERDLTVWISDPRTGHAVGCGELDHVLDRQLGLVRTVGIHDPELVSRGRRGSPTARAYTIRPSAVHSGLTETPSVVRRRRPVPSGPNDVDIAAHEIRVVGEEGDQRAIRRPSRLDGVQVWRDELDAGCSRRHSPCTGSLGRARRVAGRRSIESRPATSAARHCPPRQWKRSR